MTIDDTITLKNDEWPKMMQYGYITDRKAQRLEVPLACGNRRFQTQSFGEVEAQATNDSKGDGGGDNNGSAGDHAECGRRSDSRREEIEEQLAMFLKIVREYVVDGAPNEINIRYTCLHRAQFCGQAKARV